MKLFAALHFGGVLADQPPTSRIAQEVVVSSGNDGRRKIADSIAVQVERDSHQNLHISGLFEDLEAKDRDVWRRVRGDKGLSLLQRSAKVEPEKKAQTSFDALDKVIAAQRSLVVDIHTPFAENEKAEEEYYRKLKADPQLRQMLLLQIPDNVGDAISRYLRDFKARSSPSATQSGSDSFASAVRSFTADSDSSEMSAGWKAFKPTYSIPEMKAAEEVQVDRSAEDDVVPSYSATHHTDNYGGAVLSIPLSSQLQMSFLQRSQKISPGVEQEVAREKKWDLYLSDAFAAQERADEVEVKNLNSKRPENRP